MDGVIILNTTKVINSGMYILLILLEIIFVFTGVILTAACASGGSVKYGAIIALVTILIGSSFYYVLSVWPRENVYEVALEDNITWREFTNHYEVIEVKGNILKVKDKTEK